ncbi:MAG: YfiR family protein [Desulfobacterales bacterium]|nr:YfiR family protein [Desulfobacterales bacterium]
MKKTFIFLLIVYLMSLNTEAFAKSTMQVPEDVQASLFIRIMALHKGISNGGNVSIYVVGSHAFVRAMRKQIGKKIGKSELAEVISGDGLPEKKPSVIYVGDHSKAGELIRYTRKNKVLSITGIETLVAKGVTVGLGSENRRPKILLNLSASVEEGVDWNHAILKVASTVK